MGFHLKNPLIVASSGLTKSIEKIKEFEKEVAAAVGLKCDISACTLIHDASGVIKQLLVGATTTQLCSTLYINGSSRIQEILEDITKWMEQKKYSNISDFRGKLSLKKTENPVLYHRVQFMKHFFRYQIMFD